jgi:miniconductance mechanosensitive channel
MRYYPLDALNQFALNIITNALNVALVALVLLLLNAVISLILNRISSKFLIGGKTLIRTLHQVIKILLSITGLIIIFSIILNKSPVVILSSLGALTAIFLLVFKDSILGFVASIQVTLMGNVKVGDWIEMPKFNADGNVIDISISSIKVQNWDKTITTIPTYSLISEPVKNWQGMEEARARRICRNILIDVTSISFLSAEQIQKLHKVNHLRAYFDRALEELKSYNESQQNNTEELNIRRLTNIGLLRNYLYHYLQAHPNINQNCTILVRQKQHEANGLPLQIYCFTNTTNWVEYENIQSDIFDHIFASIESFGLKVYQYNTTVPKL